MKSEQEHPEDISGSLQGILGCLEVGLAHLSPEQRRLADDVAEPNLLLAPPANETNPPTAEH